jgi:benzil reductase ((S)-benzoin forming)
MNKKKSIVITGASSGLGECLSKSFSGSYDVINISRTISTNLHNIISNFSDLKSLKEKLKTKKLNHELCILNAGTMGEIGFASDITDEDFLDTLKINIVANKIIIDWSILNGCKNFIGISSGAATKNYDGWLNYCVSKSAFRSMFLQYQKDLPKLKFKLISPGILSTKMNKKIKSQNISLYPEMKKFHETIASPPQKASELIYRKYRDYFKSEKLEFDLRDEVEC